MSEVRVVHVVGARPNYMKIAPVYSALEGRRASCSASFTPASTTTPCSRTSFFAELPLPHPHVELKIGSGTHAEQTARALIGLERAFVELEPTLVVLPGDVNSTLAGALAAVKLGVPIVHVEAGLRSRDPSMPEEHNRVITDRLATLLLTHSEEANENLAAEGIDGDRVAFIGNTMIDTMLQSVDAARAEAAWRHQGLDERTYLLVTLHRPSLVDDPTLLSETMRALGEVAVSMPVVFPVHPRTRQRLESAGADLPSGVTLTEPLSYREFLSLELGARAVLTDSGGVQEETTVLRVPCFTLRANTERPVTITHGTNTLLGLDPARIREVPTLLERPLPEAQPRLWDGRAGGRAAEAILSTFA